MRIQQRRRIFILKLVAVLAAIFFLQSVLFIMIYTKYWGSEIPEELAYELKQVDRGNQRGTPAEERVIRQTKRLHSCPSSRCVPTYITSSITPSNRKPEFRLTTAYTTNRGRTIAIKFQKTPIKLDECLGRLIIDGIEEKELFGENRNILQCNVYRCSKSWNTFVKCNVPEDVYLLLHQHVFTRYCLSIDLFESMEYIKLNKHLLQPAVNISICHSDLDYPEVDFLGDDIGWKVGSENAITKEKTKKNLAICIMAGSKENMKFIREWVEYYLLIGASHMFLYFKEETLDNLPCVLEELKYYIDDGFVTVNDWTTSRQKPFLFEDNISGQNDCLHRYSDHFRWIGFFATDEFLTPLDGDSIIPLLEKHDTSETKLGGVHFLSWFIDEKYTTDFDIRLDSYWSLFSDNEKNKVKYRKTIVFPRNVLTFSTHSVSLGIHPQNQDSVTTSVDSDGTYRASDENEGYITHYYHRKYYKREGNSMERPDGKKLDLPIVRYFDRIRYNLKNRYPSFEHTENQCLWYNMNMTQFLEL